MPVKQKPFVSKPRTKVAQGTTLIPNAATEDRYYSELYRRIVRMSNITEREIKKLFNGETADEYFAEDASLSSQARILMNYLRGRVQPIFDLDAKNLAKGMVKGESRNSSNSLHRSLTKIMGENVTLKTDSITGAVKDILAASISENVSLITNIPQQYLTQIEGDVMRSITTGNGLQDLVPFMQKQKDITLRRARIIARDQTRKAYSNLNFARMEQIGVKKYKWLHSAGGQEPRKLHVRMSGNIYSIDKPPIIDEKTGQRGKPGDLINCRCTATPIIDFS